MADLMKSLALAASGMQAQAGRLRHVSENIANADTPGYHRKTVSFEELAGAKADEAGALVTLGAVQLDRTALARIYDPSHPMADESGYHDGSNVDLMIEIADAREAQRSYEANLKMFDQARQMSSSLIEMLRR
jgi:flagellar basal-body rod protein FlgC